MALISTLIDDFSDGVINSSLWDVTGTITETGGKLVITPTAGLSFLDSDSRYDLTASACIVDISAVTATGITGTLFCALILDNTSSDFVGFKKFGTDLVATKKVAGVESNLDFTPYSSVTHRYWRIRHDGASNVFWETSADKLSWQFRHTENLATLPTITALRAVFLTSYSGFEPSPGTFSIDAINPGLNITASGASTSSGSALLLTLHRLTGTGDSTSAGSAAITIPPLTAHAITASGASTSSGAVSIIIKSPGQLTAAGQSVSSGSAAVRINYRITANGSSFATGSATLTVLPGTLVYQYFYFEPPIIYDRPSYHADSPKWVKMSLYYGSHSPGVTGQSVLRINGTYSTIQTPTVDQMSSATEVYQGGHVYTITNLQANPLSTAGYIVTPIPINWTFYPAEDVFPSFTIYPGYQELIPV